MSENTDTDDELREQLAVTREFLEYYHGTAVETSHPREAEAYYEAIKLLDDALDHEFAPERAPKDDMWDHYVESSREAREEGWKAATLAEVRREHQREKYRSPPGPLTRLWDGFLSVLWWFVRGSVDTTEETRS